MSLTQINRLNPRVHLEYSSSLQEDQIHIFVPIGNSRVLFKTLACYMVDSSKIRSLFDWSHKFIIPLQIGSQKFLVGQAEFLDAFCLSKEEMRRQEKVGDYALSKLIAHIDLISRSVHLIREESSLARDVITDPTTQKIIEVALKARHADFEMVFPEADPLFLMVRKNSFSQIDIALIQDRLGKGGYGTVYKTHLLGMEESTRVFAAKIALGPKKEAGVIIEKQNLLKAHQVESLLALQDKPIASIRSEGREVGFLGTYYKRGDLFDSIAEGSFVASGGISLPRALELSISLIDTLEVLQKNKHLLTDIKLENIFLKQNGRAVLGDLGSIFILTEDLETMSLSWYFSPNVLRSDYRKSVELLENVNCTSLPKEERLCHLRNLGKLSQKMQVFQMGVVLFSLCQGIEEESYPFKQERKWLLKKTEEEFLFSSLIPTELQVIICRMLAEEADYELSAVLEDLKSLRKEKPI